MCKETICRACVEEETCALVAIAVIVQAPQQTKHLGVTLFNLGGQHILGYHDYPSDSHNSRYGASLGVHQHMNR